MRRRQRLEKGREGEKGRERERERERERGGWSPRRTLTRTAVPEQRMQLMLCGRRW